MKPKSRNIPEDDLRPEYDFDFAKARSVLVRRSAAPPIGYAGNMRAVWTTFRTTIASGSSFTKTT